MPLYPSYGDAYAGMAVDFDAHVVLEVSIGFASNPNVAIGSTVWTDVSADVRSFDTSRGRQYELDRFEAGTATIVLNNRHRKYDPTNTSSPHSPNVKPMRRVRIRATHNAITYDVWHGFIESIVLEYPTPMVNAGDAVAVVQCVDGFENLAMAELPDSPWAFEIWKTFRDVASPVSNVAWYRLSEDDPLTTKAANAFPRSDRDGTYISGTAAQSTSTTGLVFKSGDGAREFSHAATQAVQLPSGESGVFVNSYGSLIEAVVKVVGNGTTGSEPARTLFVHGSIDPNEGGGTNARVSFGLDTAGKLRAFVHDGTNSRQVLSTIAIDDGKVHHVAARFASATSFSVWIDGVDRSGTPTTTGTGAPDWLAESFTWRIGPDNPSATPVQPFVIDEVVIWSGGFGIVVPDADITTHAKAALDTAGGTRNDVAWGNELSGTRVDRILEKWAGIVAADIDTDAGNSTLGPTTLGGSVLEYLQKIAESEYGGLYMGADGKVRFRQRHALLQSSQHTTSQATFGDGVGELDYRGLSLPTDLTRVFNEVTVAREDGTERHAEDETSIDTYRRRNLDRTGLLHDSDLESQDAADWLLAHFKDPDTRVDAIEITPRRDAANLWPQALGRKLEDRVTVKRQPPGGGTISKQVLIQHIHHSADASSKTWTTTFQLTAADTDAYWILGTSELGVDSRLAY